MQDKPKTEAFADTSNHEDNVARTQRRASGGILAAALALGALVPSPASATLRDPFRTKRVERTEEEDAEALAKAEAKRQRKAAARVARREG